MVEAVIFDLDGVLVHTDHLHYRAWKALADELGLPFDERVNHRLRGISRMDSLNIVLSYGQREYTPREKEALAARKNETYRALVEKMTPADVEPVVLETLHTLRDRGLKLAVGSSSKNARPILARVGLGSFFDAVADGNAIVRAKPDPHVFLLAAQLLHVRPEAALVVEDAAAGIQAAVAGGFASAGLGEAASAPGVTYPLEEFTQLLRLPL